MDQLVRKDALKILNRVIEILKVQENRDIQEIRDLSDQTTHNASVFQDDCSVSLAVVIYAISKIIQRDQNALNYRKILKLLEKAKTSIVRDELHNFKLSIKQLFSEISKIDDKLRLYFTKIISEAQIKKGCKLCEHGLSTARASQVVGVSQWEMMHFIGNSKMSEQLPLSNVRSRIKFARSLFS